MRGCDARGGGGESRYAARTTLMTACTHFDGHVTQPRSDRCEECGLTTNLRVCTACGHVGCCESHHGHNTAHAKAAGHPVIKSLPLGGPRGFTWCYTCNAYIDG